MNPLRTRLLRTMGLLPASTVALCACQANVSPTPLDRSAAEPVTIRPEADLPTAAGPEATETAEPPPASTPSSTPTPSLVVRNGEHLYRDHLAYVTLSGWTPHTDVRLEATHPSTPAAFVLAEGRTDATGAADLSFLVDARAPLGAVGVQLGAGVPVPVGELTVLDNAPLFTDAAPLHPGVDDTTFGAAARWRVCVPESLYQSCPDPADFHDWQSAELVAYALGRPALPSQRLFTCDLEPAFDGSCCYVIETRPAAGGNQDPACQDDPADWGGWGVNFDTAEAAGRPFHVAEQSRVATATGCDTWQVPTLTGLPPSELAPDLAASWANAGLAEHASIASFARFTLELLAVGAPAELVARASAAQADEVRHAALCFGLASRFGGRPVGPGPLSVLGALDASHDLHAIVHAAVIEGCVQETISAAQVERAADRTTDPTLAACLHAVAEDERRHAELSWAFVRWALQVHPELYDTVARAFSAPTAAQPGPRRDDLAAWGVLSAREREQVAAEVRRSVITPCVQALLGAADAACA